MKNEHPVEASVTVQNPDGEHQELTIIVTFVRESNEDDRTVCWHVSEVELP